MLRFEIDDSEDQEIQCALWQIDAAFGHGFPLLVLHGRYRIFLSKRKGAHANSYFTAYTRERRLEQAVTHNRSKRGRLWLGRTSFFCPGMLS